MSLLTGNLDLTLAAGSQSQKHVPINNSLLILDAIVQLSVLDMIQTTPPGSPTEGDRYLVAATATGDWLGWENTIASFLDGTWVQLIPKDGWALWDQDTSVKYTYTSSNWVASGGVYDLGMQYSGTPVDTEILARLKMVRTVNLAADFAGADGDIEVNPASGHVINVTRNGVSIGSISIDTSGVFTFATVGGAEVVLAVGDLIRFIAPNPTLGDDLSMAITLPGYL